MALRCLGLDKSQLFFIYSFFLNHGSFRVNAREALQINAISITGILIVFSFIPQLNFANVISQFLSISIMAFSTSALGAVITMVILPDNDMKSLREVFQDERRLVVLQYPIVLGLILGYVMLFFVGAVLLVSSN